MYICTENDEPILNQMELSDYSTKKRTIIFRIDNIKEKRQAQKTLKPKGLVKRRRKSSKKKNPYVTNPIDNLLGVKLKTFVPVKRDQESSNFLTKTTQQTMLKFTTKKKTIGEETQPIPEIKNRNLQDASNRFSIKTEILVKLGSGGNIEMECPFCGDSVFFNENDLDSRKLNNTRLCSCDAILRISSLSNQKLIFQDFNLTRDFFLRFVKTVQNPQFDEYGNPIYTYGFLSLPNA